MAGSMSCGLSSYYHAPSSVTTSGQAVMSVIYTATTRFSVLSLIAVLCQVEGVVSGMAAVVSGDSHGGSHRKGRPSLSVVCRGHVTASGQNGVSLIQPIVTSFMGSTNWFECVRYPVKCLLA